MIIDKILYNDFIWLINIGFLDKIIYVYFDFFCIFDFVKMYIIV